MRLALWLALAAPAASGGESRGTVALRRSVAARRLLSAARAAANGDNVDSSPDDPPSCSCDCCDTVRRRPDEVVSGAEIKCIPSFGHSDTCGHQCLADVGDRLLNAHSNEDQILDYQRFCFYECKPAKGIFSPPKTACIELDDIDIKRSIDKAGNAMDPAPIYQRPYRARDGKTYLKRPGLPASAALVAAKEAVKEAMTSQVDAKSSGRGGPFPGWDDPKAATPADALKAAGSGNVLSKKESADARNEAKMTRAIEANKAANLNAQLKYQYDEQMEQQQRAQAVGFHSLRNLAAGSDMAETRVGESPGDLSRDAAGGPLDPYAAVMDIRSAAAAAKSYSVAAAKAAKAAIEAFNNARVGNWNLALDTARARIVAIQNAEKAARTVTPAPAWIDKARAAAAKASQPFLDDMAKAQQSVRDYTAAGERTAAEANALQAKANGVAKAANSLNQAGNAADAESKIMEARDMAQMAQELSTQARQIFGTADAVSKTIPQYQVSAQMAAHMAVSAIPTDE